MLKLLFSACALLLLLTTADAKIVFGIDGDLYVMNDNGSGKRRLTDNTPPKVIHLRWSLDGSQIAFTRYMEKDKPKSAELFIINADGDPAPQRLTHNKVSENYPSWSPDGQYIAFGSSRSGHREVHVIALATRTVRQLTFAEDHQSSGAPDFSPDGSQITFERFVSFRDRVGAGFAGKSIYVMDADGQHQRPLQPLRQIDDTVMQFEPRFSADGQRILFDDCKWLGEDLKCRLSFARIGGVAHVIEDLYHRFGDNFLISYAGWMQNDRAILFTMKRLDKPDPNYDIYRYAP